MKSKDLLNGQAFEFGSEESEVSARASYSDTLGTFVLWFNGAIVSSTRTFPPLEKSY